MSPIGQHRLALWSGVVIGVILVHVLAARAFFFGIPLVILYGWQSIGVACAAIGIALHDRRAGLALLGAFGPTLVVAYASGWLYNGIWSIVSIGTTLIVSTVITRLWVDRTPAIVGWDQCAECGYNLTGNRSGICPECGVPIVDEGGRRFLRSDSFGPQSRRVSGNLALCLMLVCPVAFVEVSWLKALPSKARIERLVANDALIGKTPVEVFEMLNLDDMRPITPIDGTYDYYLNHIPAFLDTYVLQLTVEDGEVTSAASFWEPF